MKKSSKSWIEKMDQHVYYNTIITHEHLNNPLSLESIASVLETRDDSIVDNPKDYHLSIIRFSVPASLIPITIAYPVPLPNTNPNLLNARVTLRYSNTDFTTNLIYIPRNGYPVPTVPVTIDQTKFGNYYFVYSYQQYLDMINVAFQTSFTALKTAFPGAPPAVAPFMIFNSETNLISLVANKSYDPVTAGGPTIEIWFDVSLYTMFQLSFESIRNRLSTLRYLQLLVKDNKNNTSLAGTEFVMEQQFIALYFWSPLVNIVFTTGMIPVKEEYIKGTSNNSRQILTDFQPTITSTNDRTNIQYFPPGEYRLVDLEGNTPLRTFDVQVWWQDNVQNLYPLLIPAEDVVTIKFLFRKKRQMGGLSYD